jgi:hypothetical protein
VFRSRVPRLSSSSPSGPSSCQSGTGKAQQSNSPTPIYCSAHSTSYSTTIARSALHSNSTKGPLSTPPSSAPSMNFTTAHEEPMSELSLLEQLPLADLTHPPPHPGPTTHHRTLSVLSNTNCVNQSHPENSSKLSFLRA